MIITDQMIQDWWECQRRFQFKYVQKAAPTNGLQLDAVHEKVLREVLFLWAQAKERGANVTKEQTCDLMMREYERLAVGCKMLGSRKTSFDRYMASAMMMLSEWNRRDGTAVTPSAIRQSADMPVGKDIVRATPDLHDGARLGQFRVANWRWSEAASGGWPLMQVRALATGIRSYWVAHFSWRTPAWVIVHHVTLDDKELVWMGYCLPMVIKSMKEGPYTPCIPASFRCNKKACEYYDLCRAEAYSAGMKHGNA